MSDVPLVSVITVVRNAANEIGETLASVAATRSTCPDLEYIVIDGASTDGTQALIRAQGAGIDRFVSEPDAGIYDAMNKGGALARGHFLLHLNVGDTLLRIPGAELRAHLAQAPAGSPGISFPVRYTDGTLFRPAAGQRLRWTNTLHHQGTFYRRRDGLHYDTRYSTFSDFDLNQRLARTGPWACRPDDAPVALHGPGGASHQRSKFHEVYDIVRANQGIAWVPVCWFHFKMRGLAWRLRKTFPSLH